MQWDWPWWCDRVLLQWDSDHIYLIMEFCAGGDLSRFIRMRRILPEKVARIFLQQLGKGTLPSSVGHPPWGFLGARTLGTQVATCSACALKFLHDHNISHLDLKPQNILLSDPENPQLKLAGEGRSPGRGRRWTFLLPPTAVSSPLTPSPADFGFAQHMSPWDEKHVLRGSPLYMAPEMVCRQQYDARVDLWSVGVILYGGLWLLSPLPPPRGLARGGFPLSIAPHRSFSPPPSPFRSAFWEATLCLPLLRRAGGEDPQRPGCRGKMGWDGMEPG